MTDADVLTPNVVEIGWTAVQIKDALRRHHPGERQGSFVGRWTCIEEWCGIDLLALDAWQSADVIGYEVKVSRSDYRAELLEPTKRMEAVSRCTQFYFAVPKGLLKPEEVAFEEPDWSLEDFERVRCPGVPELACPGRRNSIERVGGQCYNPRVNHRGKSRGSRLISKKWPRGYSVKLPVPVVLNMGGYGGVYFEGEKIHGSFDIEQAIEHQGYQRVPCPTCGGRGYVERSRVEQDAPQLWVPKDVGLVEVDARGITVVKSAPKNKTPKSIVGEVIHPERLDPSVVNRSNRQAINDLVRWVSNRPDSRHVG